MSSDYELDEIDKKIIQLCIKYPGINKSEIVRVIGHPLTSNNIQNRLDKPAVKKAMSEQLMKIPELTTKAQELALKRIIQMIQGSNDKMALEAAKVVLFPLFTSNRLGGPINVTQSPERIVFQTRIGDGGEVQREMIVEAEDVKDD